MAIKCLLEKLTARAISIDKRLSCAGKLSTLLIMDFHRKQLTIFAEDEHLVHLNEYQELALQTDTNSRRGLAGLGFPLLGLFGEVGSLLSELKKKQRDRDSYL